MCYSSETSRNFFIINIICSYMLYKIPYSSSDNKIIALYFIYVGLMQLYDWIFWNNTNNSLINKIFTKIAMITNNAQPIMFALLIVLYKNKMNSQSSINKMPKLSTYAIAIYTLVFLFYTFYGFNKIDYTVSKPELNNSLFWQWNSLPYNQLFYLLYFICVLILCYENFLFPTNYVLILITLVSFLFTFVFFKQSTIGRFWCKFASLVPLLFLIYYFVIFKKKN